MLIYSTTTLDTRSPATADRHLSKLEKSGRKCLLDGFGSNCCDAAACLPHQLVGILLLISYDPFQLLFQVSMNAYTRLSVMELMYDLKLPTFSDFFNRTMALMTFSYRTVVKTTITPSSEDSSRQTESMERFGCPFFSYDRIRSQ